LVVVSAASCNGEKANIALSEPLQVSGGQFISGALPGVPPEDGGGAAGEAGAEDGGAGAESPLLVTSVTSHGSFIPSGIPKSLGGLVGGDAVAVGVRFADMGTGYWVVPTQGLDVNYPGQRDFAFTASFNPTDRPGNHSLLFVGIASDGSGGPQVAQTFCIESRVPDNGHACQSSVAVPSAVFTLTWDTGFDVDLHVITPDGQDVNPKTDILVGDAGALKPTSSRIDRDSWGNCAPDGWHEEDLVFQDPPASGTYFIYADPYAACGAPAVHFTLTIYQAGTDGDLHSTFSQSGELLASQVTGGQSTGLFVYQTTF
jgi:hypothetical protein